MSSGSILLYSLVAFFTFCWILFPWALSLIQAEIQRRLSCQTAETRRTLQLENKLIVGFLHPYCNAGGGGERVLWAAIRKLLTSNEDMICAVYTGDESSKEEILLVAETRFNIVLPQNRIVIFKLSTRRWVEDKTWQRFTLLGQSLGSMWMAYDALSCFIPDIYIDSMGYAFTFPVVRWLAPSTPIGAYVHYPTISTNMLQRVQRRETTYANASLIVRSGVLSFLKLTYYRLFSYLYSQALLTSTHLLANSTWTSSHLDILLRRITPLHPSTPSSPLVALTPASPPASISSFSITAQLEKGKLSPTTSKRTKSRYRRERSFRGRKAHVVFPPCDTDHLAQLDISKEREYIILSLAQFRPEKDQRTQIIAFKEFVEQWPAFNHVTLHLAGSVRGEEDQNRVSELQALVQELDLQDRVEFHVNLTYENVVLLFSRASVGLSTMVDEHFGINIVEFMAAGLIPLVHRSGGPLLDIVAPWEGQPTGYHASTPAEYAEKLHHIFSMKGEERHHMRERARARAQTMFSTEKFEAGWMRGFETLRSEYERMTVEAAKNQPH